MRERVLAQHFLRRFLDNDLISPDADRREVLSTTVTALVVTGLFVSILFTLGYLLDPFQMPGLTAIRALDDRFFYVSVSMVAMGLVAAMQWDALTLDARDASVLGPLPIPWPLLLRAKLTAVITLAVGVTLALNVVPSVVYPSLMVAKLPIDMMDALTLVVAHAFATFAAGAWGFGVVVAVREILRAVLGQRWFAHVSTIVQGALVVSLITASLLLPGLSRGIAQRWLSPGTVAARAAPPLWFLGVQETIGGRAMERLRPARHAPDWIAQRDGDAMADYRALRPAFAGLASTAGVALATTLLTALGAAAWNNRRLPAPPAIGRTSESGLQATWHALVRRTIARPPATYAGFVFTLRVLARSVPQRLSVLTASAVGLAVVTAIARGLDVRGRVAPGVAPLALYAIQSVLLTTVTVGFRHAVRVPAELRASWSLHLAWQEKERLFLNGVTRAAFAMLVVPVLLLLWPLHVMTLGTTAALAHAVHGALVAFFLIQLAVLGYRPIPFAAPYVPSADARKLAPLYAVVFLSAMYALAATERWALRDSWRVVALCAAWALLIGGARIVDRRQRREPATTETDESLDRVQGLDLGG